MLFERMADLASDLKLSAEQKSQVGQILARAREDFGAMRDDLEKMDPRDRMEHVRDLFTAMQGDIAKQLNPEQAKAFEQKVDAMREQLRNRLRREAGAGAGAKAGAGAGATSQPESNQTTARVRPGGAEGPRGGALQRLKDSLDKIELSPEQKARIEQLWGDLKTKADAIRQQASGAGADVREKVRDLMQDSRARLREILTPAQQQKLRELLGAGAGDGPARLQRRDGRAGAEKTDSEMMAGGTMTADAMNDQMSGDMGAASKSRPTSPGARAAGASASAAAGLAIGAPATEVALRKLDGGLIQLSSLRGHVIVLEFGSYSSPSFRRRAAAMEQLKTDYGIRAQFFIVYTKEAHPSGGWEVDRNKDQEISIEQPASADARRQTAQMTRDKLKLTVPIVLDTMDDQVAAKFGAGENSAVVIDRDGRLAARQQWFEPVALRRHIDAAIASSRASDPSPAPAAGERR
jgi:peroxiredoxin